MEGVPSVTEILTNLEAVSDLIADAIIKKVMPVKDDISENQAKKAYGDRWIRKMKKYGLAKESHIGGRIIYSRTHLDALRIAEREHAKLFYRGREIKLHK